MTQFSIIQVFGDQSLGFKGNTAAVVELESAIEDETMQSLAADFNQPATTFLWPNQNSNGWHVRWFAPDGEIDLCGHGSLAAYAYLSPSNDLISLLYRKGEIKGKKIDDFHCSMQLDPIESIESVASPVVSQGLGQNIKSYYKNDNKHIVLLESESAVKNMRPDFQKLRASEVFGYIVTAPGDQVDFVSRTIVPHVQQLEDHATGSSHAALTPFWEKRLGKSQMTALQLSKRGGKFECSVKNHRVQLKGEYKLIAQGELNGEF